MITFVYCASINISNCYAIHVEVEKLTYRRGKQVITA